MSLIPTKQNFTKHKISLGQEPSKDSLWRQIRWVRPFQEPQNSQYISQGNIQIGGQGISSISRYVHGPQATRQETQEILSRQSCWVSQEIQKITARVHCLKIRLFRQTEHLESRMLLVQSWLNIFLGRTRNCFLNPMNRVRNSGWDQQWIVSGWMRNLHNLFIPKHFVQL